MDEALNALRDRHDDDDPATKDALWAARNKANEEIAWVAKQMRLDAGLSRRELAAKTGIQVYKLNNLETGGITHGLSLVYRIASVLGHKVSLQLVFGDEEKLKEEALAAKKTD